MIIFLLLVIIAILLFGSSAVLGVIGMVLGFIALVIAAFFGVAAVASITGYTVEEVFLPLIGCLVLLAIVMLPILAGLARLMERRRPNVRPHWSGDVPSAPTANPADECGASSYLTSSGSTQTSVSTQTACYKQGIQMVCADIVRA